MRSTTFTLAGTGKVSFLIGGGNDANNLYVALVRASDDSELMRTTNTHFADSEAYSRMVWDASAYLGTNLYFKVVDNATGGWGHINVDDFNTSAPIQSAYWPFDEGSGNVTKWANGPVQITSMDVWTLGSAYSSTVVPAYYP